MHFLRRIKQVTSNFLLFTLLLVLNTASYAQNSNVEFEDALDGAFGLLYDDPEKAISLATEAHRIAEDNGDLWGAAVGLAGLGYISYEVGDFKASLMNYMRALTVLRKSDTTDLPNEIIILNELARIQSEFNNHDESIKYLEEALDLAEEHAEKNAVYALENDHLIWLVDIPYFMAIEYQAKGAYQTAGKILFTLWDKAENKDDIATYSQVLNELGIIKMNNGEYSSAQEYFGLVVSGDHVDDWDKSMAYHNLAASYMEQGEYERAESYFLIALDLKQQLEDPWSEFLTLLDLGELEFKRKDSKLAVKYWEQALRTYSDIETDPDLYSIYNWLQLAYMDIDIERAKEYNQKYTELNNFYVKNQTEQRELEAQNRQELSAWIDQQRQDRVDAEERQRFIEQFWPVLLGVALLVLFSFILGIRYYWAMRTNRKLSRAQLSHVAQESGK